MIIYGASGHAKVIIDCLQSQNIDIKAIFDDNPNVKKLLNYEVIHPYDPGLFPGADMIVAIGNNKIRKRIVEKLSRSYRTPAALLHPTAIISDHVKIGGGSVILNGSVVQSSSKIGKFVIINTAATVDHDCVLGDYVHVAPNTTLCGGVSVGEGTLVGAGSVVIPTLKIGKWCVIGAGSVIIEDVPDYSMVVGNPGKIIKKLS